MDAVATTTPQKKSGFKLDLPFRKIPRKDLIGFTTGLATLQRAGVPLLKALQGIQKSTESRRFGRIVQTLISSIESGQSFSDALGAHPEVFDPFFVSLVEVGETTGNLDEVLDRLVENIEREDDLVSQLKSAAAYPVFSLIICTMIIGFIPDFFCGVVVATNASS